jgi:hypothetical protein
MDYKMKWITKSNNYIIKYYLNIRMFKIFYYNNKVTPFDVTVNKIN